MMFTVVCVCLFCSGAFCCCRPALGAVRDGWRVARAGRYATESLLSRSRCVLAGVTARCTGGAGVPVQRTAAVPPALLARTSLAIDSGAGCAPRSGSPCSGCTASRYQVSGLRWWWRILSRCCGWSRIPVYAPVLRKSQIKTALFADTALQQALIYYVRTSQ